MDSTYQARRDRQMGLHVDESPVLIQTKLHRPRPGRDLIPRPELLRRLIKGVNRKLTLISAQAGAGKTTLLVQLFQEYPESSAWLSLDEHDNDLTVFVSYLCGAIQAVVPDACEHALDLLNAPHSPPLRVLTTAIINGLDTPENRSSSRVKEDLSATNMVIILDDYQNITSPSIHQLIAELIKYLPHHIHLIVATRIDPPIPLTELRAHNDMTEIRTRDLQFSTEEARKLIELTIGRKIDQGTIDFLRNKTEGWAVGLHLAALSIRQLPGDQSIVAKLEKSGNSTVTDYLVSEILSQLPQEQQDFLLNTSFLTRFNADLCDDLLKIDDETNLADFHQVRRPAGEILRELRAANLFILPLDHQESWFRYHQLFRDLLYRRLQSKDHPDFIKTLHRRASRWFAQNGLIEEALTHAFAAGELDLAAQVVHKQRYRLMNQARWQQLERLLGRFPNDFIDQKPGLLMLKTWLAYHQGHYGRLPPLVAQIEASLDRWNMSQEELVHLKGEISALKSLAYYFQSDPERTILEAEYSIINTPPELWIVRILARLFLAGARQMKGDLSEAYDSYFRGFDEEPVQSNRFKATLLMSSCHLFWIAGDLQRLKDTASQCIRLCDFRYSTEIKGYGQYHLGRAYYQRNELAAAEKHFFAVVEQPFLNYGQSFADSAFCLGLIYQAQNRPDDARDIASKVVSHMLETGNTTLLPEALAFQAEIALRQGQLSAAEQWASEWASQSGSSPPLMPMFRMYQPYFTLLKTLIARGTPATLGEAAKLLKRLRDYSESTHNTVSLIQVLALSAMLREKEDGEAAALPLLRESIKLAQPGGFIRFYVDLGSPMAHLLSMLHQQGVAPNYISGILMAFSTQRQGTDAVRGAHLWPVDLQSPIADDRRISNIFREQPDSLTARESEVLNLLSEHLTYREIAQELNISLATVKTHTHNIYGKLDVRGRRQAVNKARALGLLPES